MKERNFPIERVSQVPYRINEKRFMSQCDIVKFQNVEDKEKILKAFSESKGQL